MAIIQRQPADKPGPDIVDTVLVSDPARIERGRQEINYNSSDRVLKTLAIIDSEFIAASIAFLYFGNIVIFNSPTNQMPDAAKVINNNNNDTVRLNQIIAQNAKLEKELRLVEAGYNNLEIVQLASRLTAVDNQLQKA